MILLLSFLGVWSVLAEVAEPGSARQCDGAQCHVDAEHTGLVQKSAHPVSYNKLEEAETDSDADVVDSDSEVDDPGLEDEEVKAEAKRAVADLAGWQQGIWQPMKKLAESDEIKQLEQEALGHTSRYTLPIRPSSSTLPGQTLDVNVASIQSDLRKAMQGFKAVPASEESWNLAVEALGGTANITLPRGTYLRMAENLAAAQHKVQQDTRFHDMVVSLVPVMAQMIADQSLFEPMEAVNELAPKGKIWPENGKPGGRDVGSRLPDMARQNLRAMKFVKPVLEHALNGTSFDKDCEEKEAREKALESYDERAPCATDKMCFDPQLELGHFMNWAWAASNFKKVKKKPAGMDIQFNIGLVASISGKSYRKLSALRAFSKNGGPALPMFSSLAVSLKWIGHYTNGKMMALTTEMGFLYPKLSESFAQDATFGEKTVQFLPTFSDVTVMMDYAQGGPRSTEKVTGKELTFNLFNYATWGSTLNDRIIGDTTLYLFSSKVFNNKRKLSGGVHPRFGVVLGDYSWSSGWPVQLASKWWWKSKWGLTPKRAWGGLQSGFTLPFANKCYTYTQEKQKAARELRVKQLEEAKDLSDQQVKDLKAQKSIVEQDRKDEAKRLTDDKESAENDLDSKIKELQEQQSVNEKQQAEIETLKAQVDEKEKEKEAIKTKLEEDLAAAQAKIKELSGPRVPRPAFEEPEVKKDVEDEQNQPLIVEDIDDDPNPRKETLPTVPESVSSQQENNQDVISKDKEQGPVIIDDLEEQDDEAQDISPTRVKKRNPPSEED